MCHSQKKRKRIHCTFFTPCSVLIWKKTHKATVRLPNKERFKWKSREEPCNTNKVNCWLYTHQLPLNLLHVYFTWGKRLVNVEHCLQCLRPDRQESSSCVPCTLSHNKKCSSCQSKCMFNTEIKCKFSWYFDICSVSINSACFYYARKYEQGN